jgi:hypothetical protein
MVAGWLSALVSARGREHSKAREQKNDRDSKQQWTDHHQNLLEQAEAAAMAQPAQP